MPCFAQKRKKTDKGESHRGAVEIKRKTDDKANAVDPSVENRLQEIFGNSLDEPD